MTYSVGVVGATGQVGREFLRILEEGERADLPISSLRLFASQRSAGKRITVRGQEHIVECAEPDPALFAGLDFVVSAIGDEEARVYSPVIAKAGALNVDKSNAWRMDPTVPLVVPEVNPEAARGHHGIIAGPNCSTNSRMKAASPSGEHSFSEWRSFCLGPISMTMLLGRGDYSRPSMLFAAALAMQFRIGRI